MAKNNEKTPEQVVEGKVDDNAVQPTVSPAPKEADGLKVVNVPLSASNALQAEAGIQVPYAGETEEVYKTDPYVPTHTKAQAVPTGDLADDGKVTKAKYEALLGAFNEVLESHNLDATHKQIYRAKAGVLAPVADEPEVVSFN